ncbi:hypothetical protein [Pseudomonas sp. EL_65y_Pfl2_R96]|uniref:hypothetical protein n=1 Tax=Pseudomonas sp. EL_65y_Pfl2_R96 TaxID=3088699 RepID=UPI0030DC223D
MTPITIRCFFSTGSYHARAPGYKTTASSAESARKAADRLIEKLRPTAVIDSVEEIQDGCPAVLKLYHYHFKQADET